MSRGSLGQVRSGGEQRESVLSACRGAGRSQPAESPGGRAIPGCLPFPSPLHLRVLSLSAQEPLPGGQEQPMGACVRYGMSGCSGAGWFGRAPHFTVCMAQGKVSSVPSKQRSRQALGILFSSPVPGGLACLAVKLWLWASPGCPGKQGEGFHLSRAKRRADLRCCVLGAPSSLASLCAGDPGLQHLSLSHPGRKLWSFLPPALRHGPLWRVVFSLLCWWGSLAAFAF